MLALPLVLETQRAQEILSGAATETRDCSVLTEVSRESSDKLESESESLSSDMISSEHCVSQIRLNSWQSWKNKIFILFQVLMALKASAVKLMFYSFLQRNSFLPLIVVKVDPGWSDLNVSPGNTETDSLWFTEYSESSTTFLTTGFTVSPLLWKIIWLWKIK